MAYGSRDRCDAVPTTRLVHAGDLVACGSPAPPKLPIQVAEASFHAQASSR